MATPARYRLATGTLVLAGILLAIPLVAILWVPFYGKKTPELWGFPFFYWYQLLWVLLTGFFTSAAHRVIKADRKRSSR
ncbi:MAG TPA: DUF3311 domain-containing protein [Jatrophihabitans sp.]|nr:DUF3311 domain-containing protein [Jatrophihabitans sp.]